MTGTEPLVLIEWEDAYGGCADTWREYEKDTFEPTLCRSVGWLIHDGKDRKVVLPHTLATVGEPLQGCGEMIVPTGMVTKMMTLTVGAQRGNA